MNKLTDSEIAEIMERCEAATEGPWDYSESKGDCGLSSKCPRDLIYCDDECPKCEHWEIHEGAWPIGPEYVECGDYSYFTDDDAAFIANSRTDIPALLAYIEQLQSDLAAAMEDMKIMANAMRDSEELQEGCCFACICDGQNLPDGCILPYGECPGYEETHCFEWRGTDQPEVKGVDQE